MEIPYNKLRSWIDRIELEIKNMPTMLTSETRRVVKEMRDELYPEAP